MISVKFSSITATMPTKWSELLPDDRKKFVSLCQALDDFEEGRLNFEQMRVSAVLALLGIDFSKLSLDEGYLNENVFRLLPYTDFLYDIQEDNRVYLNSVLSEQLIPEIGNFQGYRFSVRGGVLDCSLTAEQYVDALSLMKAFTASSDRNVLKRLCATLYCPGDYDPQKAATLEIPFKVSEQLAIYYNFRGILEWIKKLPSYDLIFRMPDSDETAAAAVSPLGLSGSIFAIAKAGYGDIASIKQLDLFSYLGVLVQMTMDSIRSLAAAGIKPVDIADRLHLHIDQVLSVTSQNS